MVEEWKIIEIDGCEKYSISNFGNVKSSDNSIIKKSASIVFLNQMNGKTISRNIAMLVLLHFGGPRGSVLVYIDGDRNNNHIDNLKWKYSREMLKNFIVDMATNENMTKQEVLEKYNVYKSLWGNIKKRSNFKEIIEEAIGDKRIIHRGRKFKYSDEFIDMVCGLLSFGYTIVSISRSIQEYRICDSILKGALKQHPIVKSYDLSRVSMNTKNYFNDVYKNNIPMGEFERWEPVHVDGVYYDYEVSDHGNVRRISSGRLLKRRLDKCGYVTVTVSLPHEKRKENSNDLSGRSTLTVAKAVADAFLNRPNKTAIVSYIDNDRSNVKANNLYFRTMYTPQDENEVIRLHGTGMCINDIANIVKTVTPSDVYKILGYRYSNKKSKLLKV